MGLFPGLFLRPRRGGRAFDPPRGQRGVGLINIPPGKDSRRLNLIAAALELALESGAVILSLFLSACTVKAPAQFPYAGVSRTESAAAWSEAPPWEGVLYGFSKEAVSGVLKPGNPGKPRIFRYAFEPPLRVPRDYSLELSYSLQHTGEPGEPNCQVVLDLLEGGAWELPQDASFLDFSDPPGEIRYAVPVPEGEIGEFTLSAGQDVSEGQGAGGRGARGQTLVFALNALRLIPRWYGFYRDGPVLAVTPFVFAGSGGPLSPGAVGDRGPSASPAAASLAVPVKLAAATQSGDPAAAAAPLAAAAPAALLAAAAPPASALPAGAVCLDPPPAWQHSFPVELQFRWGKGALDLRAGARVFTYRPPVSGPGSRELILPRGILPADPYPVILSAPGPVAAVILAGSGTSPFPEEPIPGDPGMVLAYPPAAWRDSRYEVFRWTAFPRILIFDTRDYEVQERLFKRLAFFVEKAGYRGRLLTDRELRGLHGWNAHDYRAEDLAEFFETVRRQGFPLLPEEEELLAILLENGILLRGSGTAENPGILPGEGAVISISQESPGYLRRTFMVHEGFHGLFFIDEDFQDFSRDRWENLDPQAKRFLLSVFDSQRYDTKDPYLVINEFMSYCLQQPVSQAGGYFGDTLARRINENSWRRTVLPPMDEATGTWPSLARAFAREAQAFSDYVNRRWGLAAGRISSLEVHTQP